MPCRGNLLPTRNGHEEARVSIEINFCILLPITHLTVSRRSPILAPYCGKAAVDTIFYFILCSFRSEVNYYHTSERALALKYAVEVKGLVKISLRRAKGTFSTL